MNQEIEHIRFMLQSHKESVAFWEERLKEATEIMEEAA